MTREEYFASSSHRMKIRKCAEMERTDFLIRIDESLVPPYSKGDLLMVQKQPDVFEGEIGLFLIDGKPHVKSAGKTA